MSYNKLDSYQDPRFVDVSCKAVNDEERFLFCSKFQICVYASSVERQTLQKLMVRFEFHHLLRRTFFQFFFS